MKNKVLWGTKNGAPSWAEEIITDKLERIEAAKKWAIANGFINLRLAEIDISKKPDFKKCINVNVKTIREIKMKLENWQKHIDSIKPADIRRPSQGGNKETWKQWYNDHLATGCQDCRDRARTRKANQAAKAMRDAVASVGMKRVVGNLGGVYYE
jgi:hypothetical protein